MKEHIRTTIRESQPSYTNTWFSLLFGCKGCHFGWKCIALNAIQRHPERRNKVCKTNHTKKVKRLVWNGKTILQGGYQEKPTNKSEATEIRKNIRKIVKDAANRSRREKGHRHLATNYSGDITGAPVWYLSLLFQVLQELPEITCLLNTSKLGLLYEKTKGLDWPLNVGIGASANQDNIQNILEQLQQFPKSNFKEINLHIFDNNPNWEHYSKSKIFRVEHVVDRLEVGPFRPNGGKGIIPEHLLLPKEFSNHIRQLNPDISIWIDQEEKMREENTEYSVEDSTSTLAKLRKLISFFTERGYYEEAIQASQKYESLEKHKPLQIGYETTHTNLSATKLTTKAQILKILKEEKIVKRAYFLEHIDRSAANIDSTLKKLIAEGKIKKVDYGVYSLNFS